MAAQQLPVYLQNRTTQDFTDYASDGLGTALPPHVSIGGNTFTLIDATGQEYQPMQSLDCVIIDRSNVTCKMYFEKDYTPGSDEPPTCWSSNGVGPSREAIAPQARTCAECQWNVRGSKISKISGASIKACRDEYYMAILLPAIPDMLFRLVLTPGSFDNWQAYTAKFKNSNVRISMVVTRLTFVPKVNGVLDFQSISYIDETTNNVVQKALIEKATDVLCGRLDQPRTTALPTPIPSQVEVTRTANREDSFMGTGISIKMTGPPPVQQPVPLQIQPATSPAPVVPQTNMAGPAAGIPATTDTAPQTRRRRRTAAEMAMANGGSQAGQGPVAAPQAAPQAPFPHPGQPAGASSNFGIQQGQPAAVNPELATMLDDFFKPGT